MEKKEFIFLIISKLRFPLILLILVYTISMFGLVLIPTYDNEGNLYNLSFFDAFFIVVYTSTTVGFGETPFAWTNYQKLWMAFTTISTVTAWLISIGRIISIIQDPIVKEETTTYFFKWKVKKIREPFYIIAGFGQTGEYLSKILVDHGVRVIIIEKDKMTLDSSSYIDYKISVPSMYGDIKDLELLKISGILNPYCQGLILTTSDEFSNSEAALNARILNPNLKIISRAHHFETKNNLKSFDTDYVVSPYRLFGEHVSNNFNKNHNYLIKQFLTSEMFNVSYDYDSLCIPRNNWAIVDFEKFGKILYKKLKNNIPQITVFSNLDNINISSKHTHVKSEGVSKEDLIDLDKIKVLVLTGKDDHKNLSTIYTAKKMNENIFIISVINKLSNYDLYEKLDVNIIIKPHELMVREIFPIISEPLLGKFLDILKEEPEGKQKNLYSMIKNIENPLVWSYIISEEETPTLYNYLSNNDLTIQDILSNTISSDSFCIPLTILKNENNVILPKYLTKIEDDNIILFVGNLKAKNKLDWIVNNQIFFEESIEKSKKYCLIDYISD